MNFENYRRAMDKQTLSEDKKAAIRTYANAVPLHGSSRFARARRRKIAGFISLAACFTFICLAGIPFVFALTLRAGNTAPEESAPTATQAEKNHWLYNSMADQADCETSLTGNWNPTVTGATAATTAGSPNAGGYDDIYMLVNTNTTTDTEITTSENTSAATIPSGTGMPRPSVKAKSFSAEVGTAPNTVSLTDGSNTGTIVFSDGTDVVLLLSWENYLIACTEQQGLVTAFVYDAESVQVPRLLGSFGISGILVDADCSGGYLSLKTEFTPIPGNDDLAAYIPQIFHNSGTGFISPEDCIVTYAGNGSCTCYVVTELDISQDVSLVSIRAEFAEK